MPSLNGGKDVHVREENGIDPRERPYILQTNHRIIPPWTRDILLHGKSSLQDLMPLELKFYA
jgi:hypothetical protein